jgi:hypothetical protein
VSSDELVGDVVEVVADNMRLRTDESGDLEKTVALIRAHPGIRPSEINRLLNREESDGLRGTLIKRRLVGKEKDRPAMRYYPV